VFIVTVQVSADACVHPLHDWKELALEVAAVVSVTEVPALYVRVKVVVPPAALLLSAGLTAMVAPLEGEVELTVST
jgi:hypothetical protein